MMRLLWRIDEFEPMPWWLGVCWISMEERRAICFPIPLNWPIAFGRWLWASLRRPDMWLGWPSERKALERKLDDYRSRLAKIEAFIDSQT